MKISDRVYLVGSGKHGNLLTHPRDCNVYLLDGGSEAAIIDAGGGIEPERIVACIDQSGISMSKVKWLLLTHVHGDHAAGAYYFYKEFGLQVIAASEAAPWLEEGDMDKTSLNAAIRAGVYPADFHFPACPVAVTVTDGDRLRVGDLELTVINTPGHSRGHISFFWEESSYRSLFSGDVVFAGGRIVLQNIWDCFIQEYAGSVSRLSKLRIDRLFPGHGPFLLSRAWEHIDLASGCFERLELPPNL